MAEFKILRTWEIQTNVNCLLHSSSSEYYSKLNMFFMIPIIILSSSTGTLGLMNTSSSQIVVTNNVNVISLLVGIFGFLSAMLTTIHNFLGIQRLQSTHSFHSVEYNKISREIKMHIYLSETDVKVYANIAEYIKHCRAKIDKLIETAPEIPHHIEERLQPKIKLIKSEDNNELNEIITLSNVRNSMCARHSIDSDDDNDHQEERSIRKNSIKRQSISDDDDHDHDHDHQQERSFRKCSIQSEPTTQLYSQHRIEQNDNIAMKIFSTDENIQRDESPSSDEIHSRFSIDEPSGISTLRENSMNKMKFFFSSLDAERNDGEM